MVVVIAIGGTACSSSSPPSSGSGGGHPISGATGQGGTTGSGGQPGTGGVNATGGAPSQGGTVASGGTTQSGAGGVNRTGGAPSQGGTIASGGTTQSGTGGANRTGGTPSQGGTIASGGQLGTGGVNTGGGTGPERADAGTGGRLGSGGTGVGGASTGTGGTTPAGSGGSGAFGGATGPGSGGSSGGAGADAGAAQSAGCGKTRTLQNGTITIQSNGSRNYILRVPANYDNSHAYRLVIAYAWSGASSTEVANSNYFTFSTQDSQNTIFVAPNASDGAGSWSKSDVAFTDAILAQIEGDLCIDLTRVFATGFSFGGAMSLAIACTRADVFRAVAFFSGADLTGSCPTTPTTPIAYYASQASEDSAGMSSTSPILGELFQAKFAAVNGCTPVPTAATFPASGQAHVCTKYQGCSAGHPTEYCVFNGPHGWEPVDPGQTASWDPPEAWKFITQF